MGYKREYINDGIKCRTMRESNDPELEETFLIKDICLSEYMSLVERLRPYFNPRTFALAVIYYEDNNYFPLTYRDLFWWCCRNKYRYDIPSNFGDAFCSGVFYRLGASLCPSCELPAASSRCICYTRPQTPQPYRMLDDPATPILSPARRRMLQRALDRFI